MYLFVKFFGCEFIKKFRVSTSENSREDFVGLAQRTQMNFLQIVGGLAKAKKGIRMESIHWGDWINFHNLGKYFFLHFSKRFRKFVTISLYRRVDE